MGQPKLTDLLNRPIAFHRCLVPIAGSVNAALLLSQAIYWTKRTKDEDGWFYKSIQEWEEETGLTRTEQATARAKLKSKPFWQEQLKNMPAILHYRVDLGLLLKEFAEFAHPQFAETPQTSLQESCKLDSRIPANKFAQIVQTINKETETTTETTREGEPTSDRVTISDALEDIYPGHATDIRLMNQLRDLVKRVDATPEHILAFPAWLAERYPAKANGPFAFKDLFPEYVKSSPSLNGNGNGNGAAKPAADRCKNCNGAGKSVRRGPDRFKPGQLLETCPICDGTGTTTTGAHHVSNRNRNRVTA